MADIEPHVWKSYHSENIYLYYTQHQELELDSDAQFYLLKTMKFLVLHAQCLNYTVHDHEHFVKFCLHKLLIPK